MENKEQTGEIYSFIQASLERILDRLNAIERTQEVSLSEHRRTNEHLTQLNSKVATNVDKIHNLEKADITLHGTVDHLLQKHGKQNSFVTKFADHLIQGGMTLAFFTLLYILIATGILSLPK